MKVNFLSKYFGGEPNGKNVSVDRPAGTITTSDHHSFITAYYGNGHNHSVNAPSPTLTTRDRLAFVNVQYENSVPCDISASIYDSPAMAKIKRFMALYGIIDIKMRMLRIRELKRIMGFPADYVLVGTQADQKKFIGNAVEVTTARVLCEALCYELQKKANQGR